MDMIPPQAPPAITQGANQEAVDAVSRLVDTQAWLVEQQAEVPAMPDDRSPATLQGFLAEFDAFWRLPVPAQGSGARAPRSVLLASQLASIMGDEALLRLSDGTLAHEACDIARRFARSHGGALPPGLHAREMLLDGVGDAAAVAVTDDHAPDIALLFTPARGWQTFSSLTELHEEATHQVNLDIAQGTPPSAIPVEDRLVFDDIVRVDSREIEGEVFDALARRLLDVQRERLRSLWEDEPAGADVDAERAMAATRLSDILDIEAMLRVRNARLTALLIEDRLASLPENVQEEWRDAAEAHQAALQRSLRSDDMGTDDIVPLREFARDAVKRQLAAKGVAVDPDEVTVSAYTWPRGGLYVEFDPKEATLVDTFSLTDLALKNIGIFDARFLVATRPGEQPLSPALTHGGIRALVRDLDVARKYHDYLLDVLKRSPEGQLTRALSADLQRARMRLDLADARVSQHRSDEVDPFRPDRAERGHAWARAVVDSPTPGGRARVEGHTIVASQVTYNGAPVSGVLMIAAAQELAVPNVVLYTPDAPDGRAFREFRSRGDASAAFFDSASFDNYLLDRLPHDVAAVEAERRGRHFARSAASERFRWVFSQGSGSSTPRKAHRFEEKAITGDVFETQYDASLFVMTRNIEPIARTSSAALADDFPDIDVEETQRAFSRFIGRPFKAAWESYDSIKAGDYRQGFIGFTDAYASALDYLPIPLLKPLAARTIAVRTARQSRQVASTGKVLRDPDAVFPSSYRATVKASDAQSVDRGIHDIDGKPHIRQGHAMYAVRFDTDAATWRVVRPNAAASAYAIPVARDAAGAWRFNRHVGLRGGQPGSPRPADLSDILRELRQGDPSVRGMTEQQLRAMERHLVTERGSYEAAQALAFRRTKLLPMRGTEAEHWRAASDAARTVRTIGESSRQRAGVGHVPVAQPARQSRHIHDLIPIDRTQWPASVRHFTRADSLAAIRTEYFLDQSLARRSFPSGVYVTTLDPSTTSRDQISRAISGTNQWRRAGNFQKKMETWLELDTGKLPPGTMMYRVNNTSDKTYVIRPPRLGGNGHAVADPGFDQRFSLPGLNIREAVIGTGRWPITTPR